MLADSQGASGNVGMGMAIIVRSVMISVAVNTLSICRVSEHCVNHWPIPAPTQSKLEDGCTKECQAAWNYEADYDPAGYVESANVVKDPSPQEKDR